MIVNLSDETVATILGALRVARDTYRDDAKRTAGTPRVAEAFHDLAERTDEAIAIMEEAQDADQ